MTFPREERAILRANQQWGGQRTLIYLVEIESGVYAEIWLRRASLSGDPLQYEPLFLAIAQTIAVD